MSDISWLYVYQKDEIMIQLKWVYGLKYVNMICAMRFVVKMEHLKGKTTSFFDLGFRHCTKNSINDILKKFI